MKLKKLKLTENDQVFVFDDDLEVFVSEDREFVLELDEVDELLENGDCTFEKEDVIFEAKKKMKKEADDEDEDEDEDEDDSEDDDEDEDEEDDDKEKKLKEAIATLMDFQVEISEEDKSALFGEDSVITEAVQAKTVTLFEATVRAKSLEILEQISEEYEAYTTAMLEANEKKVHAEVNEYLDYVITEWVAENEIAIESSLKLEMSEKFIEGLGDLYKEHYIEVPEGRYDILEGLADKVEELEEKLEVEIKNNAKLMAETKTATKDDIIKTLSSELTESQKEKFATLVENFKDNDIESFETKASDILESFFKKSGKSTILTEDQPSTDVADDEDDEDDSLIGRASRL